jgi:hypothetical protein
VEIDNNLSLGFSHDDFCVGNSKIDLSRDGILGEVGRFLDKFKGELGRVSRVDTVDLKDAIFEEMKL